MTDPYESYPKDVRKLLKRRDYEAKRGNRDEVKRLNFDIERRMVRLRQPFPTRRVDA